ncbi:MAG: T9SS type A sorting domain-containing protein [Ignavibacteria bacterium]|nr:T9SS type A sorting domain-containing protein [Ignavibacteria bacterium]
MKKIISLFMFCVFAISAFGQDAKHSKTISNSLEDGKQTSRTYVPQSVLDAPPLYKIPGTDGFWDYITNGSNMQNIMAFGDTIIVCYPVADSSDAIGANSRLAYYIVSFNGGSTWEDPLPVSALPSRSGYPEVYSYIFAGLRQVALSGRKYNSFGARGGAWKDVLINIGSITGVNLPEDGRDFFGAYLNGNFIGGLTNFPNALTNGTIDTLYFFKYDAANNSFGSKIKIAEPSIGQIGGSVRYRLAADQTGNNVLAVWYKDTTTGVANTGLAMSLSTNSGSSWTTPSFIQKFRKINDVVGGDTVTPWYGIDAAFKPGSTNFGVVWSCLYPNTTAGNYLARNTNTKILFYSPNINDGKPTIVAGSQNMNILSDTSLFNNQAAKSQVGVLPVSHPSIAYSADGSRIFVSFSAYQSGDSLDGFSFNDIWYTFSDDGGLTWASPRNLTNTHTDDELYPTISLTGNSITQFHVHYQSTKGPGSQSFNDNAPVYRVYQCYQKVNVTAISNVSTTVPERFSLKQNYPNPFNPTTSIRFDVAKTSKMTLKVYDMSGKLVQTLFENELVGTGTNEVTFEASKLSSGVYFYTLSSDNYKETKKMMLVK